MPKKGNAVYAHYASSKARDKEIREINHLRGLLGLKKLEIKKRKCLRCGKEFPSESTSNRVCISCKTKSAKNESFYEYYGV